MSCLAIYPAAKNMLDHKKIRLFPKQYWKSHILLLAST